MAIRNAIPQARMATNAFCSTTSAIWLAEKKSWWNTLITAMTTSVAMVTGPLSRSPIQRRTLVDAAGHGTSADGSVRPPASGRPPASRPLAQVRHRRQSQIVNNIASNLRRAR